MLPILNRVGKTEEGAALISALWLSLILALMAVGLIHIHRESTITVRADTHLKKIWLDADSVTLIAAHRLAGQNDNWREHKTYDLSYNAKTSKVYIRPISSRLNLNAAPESELSQLMLVLGYDIATANQMAARIADFRDSDDLTRVNGAEKEEYELAGLAPPNNADFEQVSDLKSVISVNMSDLSCLTPYLSVFGGAKQLKTMAKQNAYDSMLGFPVNSHTSAVSRNRRGTLAGQLYEIYVASPFQGKVAMQSTLVRFTGQKNNPIWIHQIQRTIVAEKENIFSFQPSQACPIMKDSND